MGTESGAGATAGIIAVDPQALRIAAERLDAAADILHTARRTHLSGLRAEEAATSLARWELAARETAAALRTAEQRYVDSEARGARALR